VGQTANALLGFEGSGNWASTLLDGGKGNHSRAEGEKSKLIKIGPKKRMVKDTARIRRSGQARREPRVDALLQDRNRTNCRKQDKGAWMKTENSGGKDGAFLLHGKSLFHPKLAKSEGRGGGFKRRGNFKNEKESQRTSDNEHA